MKRILQAIVLPGILASFFMAFASFVINEAILGEEHARYDFFRSDDELLRVPGLAITSLFWGPLLATAYHLFGGSLRIQSGAARGAVFGLALFLTVAFLHELFYFQFIRFSPAIIIGAELHYLVSYTVGGALIGGLAARVERA